MPRNDLVPAEQKKRNLMSRKDEFRLADWIRSRGSSLEEMTQQEAADAAAVDLKIPAMSAANIRNVVADLGLKIHFKICRQSPSGTNYGEGIKARLSRCEQLIAHLYAKLGEAVPVCIGSRLTSVRARCERAR